MKAQISIPILLALVAFVLADHEYKIFTSLANKSFALEDRNGVRARLRQIGKYSQQDYENFRLAQLSLVAAYVTIITGIHLVSLISFLTYLACLLVGAPTVALLLDRNLSNRCKKRLADIESEFPAVVEMLTLSVGAGESPINSLKRISSRAHGILADEFSSVIQEVESGKSLTIALDAMSQRIISPNVRRFVDSLIISLTRGTSLVETFSHSVQESRNLERVKIVTAAGKSEISMMIPIVFLILPISIIFALFPSISALQYFGS
jgi:tight adherence protein C